LHHVGLEFETLFARAFGLSLAARRAEIRKTDDFRADEPFLDVRVDGARRFPGGRARANRPGAVFLSSDREKADVTGLFESCSATTTGLLDKKL